MKRVNGQMYYGSKMEALEGAMKRETDRKKTENQKIAKTNRDLKIHNRNKKQSETIQKQNILLIGYRHFLNAKLLTISIQDLKNMVKDTEIKNSLEEVIENRYSGVEMESNKESLSVLETNRLTDQEYINRFNEMFNERLAAIDIDLLDRPSILIQYSEAEELKSNSLIPFAEANKFIGELEEKYQNEIDYKKTKYHLVFPKNVSLDNEVSVVDMDELNIGDEMFIDPWHQINKTGTLSLEQKKILEEEVDKLSLSEEKEFISQWLNTNRKLIMRELER